ncbi:MAG: hypothetical protein K9M54_05025 [Kiritimatiellales bacterium]|nr:hypothetical protein [Kiritimatiellales bacterium]MCF7863670.1 hypothetical protein [Kiritimatiellales bacterium]
MKTIATILILGFAAATAWAGSDEIDAQFFHPAASRFIQGDSTTASNLVAKGLALYPDDGKLKRLKELLDKQQEQKQNQDNQNQDQQKNDQQQNQDQDKQDQKQNDQDKNKQDQQQQDQKNQQEQQPEPQSAEQMNADEAKQLMDAMKQEEQNKRLQLHPVMGAPVKVEKDW